MAVDVRDLLRQLRERQNEQEERTTVQVQTGDPFDRLLEKAKEQRATRPPMVDELLGMAARNILAGVGDFLTGAAAAGDWMQHHPLLGVPPELRSPIPSPLDVMRAVAGWAGPRLSAVGTEPVPFEGARSLVDPAYLATAGARALGGSLPLMIGGAAAGAVFRAAHPVVQALVAGGASRALEGSIEAGSVFEEALARGMSPEEAAVAAGRTFAANLGLTGVDAAQFALSFLPLGRPAATAVGRAVQAAGRVAGAAATEAAEEGVQEAIQRWALRDPIALDPRMQEALALGGLLGGAFGAAGQITQAVAPDVMRARPEEAAAPTPAESAAPAPDGPPVATDAPPVPEVLRPFAGRRLTRFELSRLPVEQQRAIRDALTEENASLLQITVAPAARKYLETRFPAEFEVLVTAWEQAGVPNELIARTVERTDPQSLRKRQQRLERQGLVDLPMYQPGRWVRVRAGETDFSAAQRAFVDAGRPRGLLDLTRVEEDVPVVAPAPEREPAAPTPAVPPAEPEPAPVVQGALPFSQAELPPPVDVEAVRRSLQDTGSARVGEHVIRIVPHPEASGRTLDSYAVEWTAPDGARSLRPTPPLTIEAAMDEAVRTAQAITGAPAEARAEPARRAPETPSRAEPTPPAAAPTRERALQIAQDVLRERTERPTAPPPAQAAAPATEAARPVTVQRVRPASELTTEELVARVKAEAPDPQVGYGIFVRYRNLRPEISMPEFRRIWEAVAADPGVEVQRVDFQPTHVLPTGERIQATVQGQVVRWVSETGRTGSDPVEHFRGRPISEVSAGEQQTIQGQALSPFQPTATGYQTTARTERGTPVTTQYAVVEVRDLITSHDTSLRPDPRFPQELQPRDRTRAASELQVTRIAQDLHPEWLGESPKASEGAPIVGPDGIVESGNARVIALKRLAEQRHPNLGRYRRWLAENAERFGLDPAVLEGMEAPVLVRIRRSDVDRVQFVHEANEAAVAAMSATEQALADARRMGAGLLARFVPSETGEINIASNREFISAFINEVVAPADRPRYSRPGGGISAEGLVRIRNALFARAYGDPDVIMQLAEDPDSNIRNITGAMLNVAPRLAIIKDRIAEGSLHPLDITQEMAQAARKLSSLRQQGQTVEMYLAQTTLLDPDLSPLARTILEVFDRYGRSRKRLTEVFQTYADMVEAAGHPGQVSLFGDVPVPTRESILAAAVQEVEARYAGRTPADTGVEVPAGRPASDGEDTPTVPPVAPAAGETRGFPAAAAEPRVAHERPRPSDDTPVITRKQAIDYIEREFLMPVREGRLSKRGARGQFNLRTHVTRLRRAEDFRALTHEFGHFLSETLDLKPENYPELQPLGAALYPDADVALQHEEGAAEFFYLYFSRPEQAQAAAPTFYADFEERLRREAELGAKIRQAQKLLMAQFNQTGTAAIKAAIVREEAKDRPFLTPWQRFYARWIDDLHPFWRLMKYVLGEENVRSEWDVKLAHNPYVLARLARGRWAKAAAFLTRGQFSPTFERIGPSLREILRPVASRIEDFEAYLVAKRALELHKRGINPGVSREDAEVAVRELESPEFQTAQRQLVEYQDNLIEHLIDAGVLNRETADAFRRLNRDYVPFYRYFGEETVTGGFAGARLRFGNLPQPVKAIRGSTRSIMSPLQSIIRNTYALIDVAERNRVARALADLANQAEGVGWLVERVPTPMQPNKVVLEQLRKDLLAAGIPEDVLSEADLDRLAVTFSPVRYARIKESRENILTVYRDGKPEFYQLHPELYRAMQFLDQPSSHWLFRLLSVPTQILRAGATLNIDFSPRNLARDQFSALMHQKYRFIPFVDPARAMFHAIRGNLGLADELYDKWVASGGAQSTMVSLNREYLERDLRRLIGERSARDRAVQIIRSPITALEFISSVLEESTRLAQFRAGLRAEGETPEGIRRAAYASREISVDFQRAGTYGRQANQIKAFFNAAVQGTDQMARLFRRDPIGYTIRAFTFITLPSIALYLLNKDDPRYQELPQWRKDLYWVILGEDEIIFYPKPFEIGVLFGTLPERILRWVEENDPEAFEGFARTLMEATMPVDPTNPLDWLPDAFTPILEVYANRNLFTDRPIIPRGEEQLLPEAQYGPETTEAAKYLGRLLGVSPRQVEHILTGYGGGLARHTLRFLDALAGVESTRPIVRPFSGDPFVSAASLDEFYEELDQLERAQRTANELRKRGLTAQVQVNEWRLRQMRRTRDQLASLRRLRRTILEDPRLSVDEKRRMSDDITLRMVNMARVAIGKPPIQPVPQASGM